MNHDIKRFDLPLSSVLYLEQVSEINIWPVFSFAT